MSRGGLPGGMRSGLNPTNTSPGGPEACLRIHFFIDDEASKFVVAHVGRHKTNTKS